MPMYEYECQTCGQKFSQFVSLSKRDEAQECPNCGQTKSERMVSMVSSLSGGGSCGSSGGHFT